MPLEQPTIRITDTRHPMFRMGVEDWFKWRLTYAGGEEFRYRYLKKYTRREAQKDFELRREITPIPAFAKGAINDIRNAIFQRMADVTRQNGSKNYQNAIAGLDGGVDLRGSTMNSFLGLKVLSDLLVMGRVGVFVDMPTLPGVTMADAANKKPYLYCYPVEDILNWSCSKPDDPSEFKSLLLCDTCLEYDTRTFMPLNTIKRYRMLWIDDATGFVNVQFYDDKGQEVGSDGTPGIGPMQLGLTRIPFVMLDIGDSLIKDVADHQIALLNLGSSDINYALTANFPFYVEQRDNRSVGHHLKQAANPDGTATAGGQGAADREVQVGATVGRSYDLNTNQPAFINPSSEPLKASLELQEKLENDVRKLVNLAVTNLAGRISGESKQIDNQGLEAGLSFIGLVLEAGERKLADFYASYEQRTPSKRNVATVKYPDRYSLKTDLDRINEATKLSELIDRTTSRTAKKEIQKLFAGSLLGGRVAADTAQKINGEIDDANFTTGNPKTIIEAKNAGLCSEKTGCVALGFDESEYLRAREDHVDRVKRLAEQQGMVDDKAGARGVPDLSGDPAGDVRDEKEQSRDTTLEDSTASRTRGEGKDNADRS